jgi:hypothetical protein
MVAECACSSIEPGKPIQNAFTDGNQLEDYCDGLPDEFAEFPEPDAGMEKLDFAKDAPAFRETTGELMK